MKLRIRYENEMQEIELSNDDAESLWLNISIEDGSCSNEEKEQRIQDYFDKNFNRPEYNVFHRETRHIDPNPKARRMDGKAGYICADPGDKAFNIMDYLLTVSDEDARGSGIEYTEVCSFIRLACGKKQNWADAFIKIHIDGMSVNDYAQLAGVKDASAISHMLRRAESKVRNKYLKERQL